MQRNFWRRWLQVSSGCQLWLGLYPIITQEHQYDVYALDRQNDLTGLSTVQWYSCIICQLVLKQQLLHSILLLYTFKHLLRQNDEMKTTTAGGGIDGPANWTDGEHLLFRLSKITNGLIVFAEARCIYYAAVLQAALRVLLAPLSVCPSVPYGLVIRKQKNVEKSNLV